MTNQMLEIEATITKRQNMATVIKIMLIREDTQMITGVTSQTAIVLEMMEDTVMVGLGTVEDVMATVTNINRWSNPNFHPFIDN